MTGNKYNIIYYTSNGAYKEPASASQVFDKAEEFAKQFEAKVMVVIIEPFKNLFDKQTFVYLTNLRKRCPSIEIHLAGGVKRLNGWPLSGTLKKMRKRMGQEPSLHHLHEADNLHAIEQLIEKFPKDKLVIDVRGDWPSEWLYTRGVKYPSKMDTSDPHFAHYATLQKTFKNAVQRADYVTTVSESLRELIMNSYGGTVQTGVVPCCVNEIPDRSARNLYRERLGLSLEDVAIIYSGGTQPNQHLPDLLIPFIKIVLPLFPQLKFVFLSKAEEEIKAMLEEQGVNMHKIRITSAAQQDVKNYLIACDAGIILREPTVVNKVAQPVKIGEYFAAGLPLIYESGIGGVPEKAAQLNYAYGISTFETSEDQITEQFERILSEIVANNDKEYSRSIQNFAKEHFTWESCIKTHKQAYERILAI